MEKRNESRITPLTAEHILDAVSKESGLKDPVFALVSYLESAAEYGGEANYIYPKDVELLCRIVDEATTAHPHEADSLRNLRQSLVGNIVALWSMADTFAEIWRVTERLDDMENQLRKAPRQTSESNPHC